MNLSTFWKSKRANYRVILKSGASFYLSATDLKITFIKDSMQLQSYHFAEPQGEIPWHVSPLEIAAITQLT